MTGSIGGMSRVFGWEKTRPLGNYSHNDCAGRTGYDRPFPIMSIANGSNGNRVYFQD